MEYSAKQIDTAKANYSAFLQYTTVEAQNPSVCGMAAAEQRCESHNKTVNAIMNGDVELEREWKYFFLNEEVKKDQKNAASKAKLAANKEASYDMLAPIKKLRKLGEFGKWLNDSSNPFRKQHFNKAYTQNAVDGFLATL